MSKTFTFNSEKEPAFKRNTITGVVHANLLKASVHSGGKLNEEQIVLIVERLKSKGFIASKADAPAITKGYLREAKKDGLASELES